MKYTSLLAGFVPVAAIVAPASVMAEQYLTLAQAQRQMFPQAAAFQNVSLKLSDEQIDRIEKASHVDVRTPAFHVWQPLDATGRSLGLFVVDEVYGKHEFITYAVAMNPQGAVLSVEVMDYRETYGGEITNPAWRRQFVGKQYGDTLELKEDIQNISGATLSCKHITEGIRRILATRAVLIAA